MPLVSTADSEYSSVATILHNSTDLIFTGTPAGIGATQGKLLKDGDMLSTTIHGIGTIENKCVRISDHTNASFIPEFLLGKMPSTD